jgi:hypothetical protein
MSRQRGQNLPKGEVGARCDVGHPLQEVVEVLEGIAVFPAQPLL